jgi:hypothetical protein
MASVVARAHSSLLVVLEQTSRVKDDTASQLVGEAVELLICVARVGAEFGSRGNDSRAWLADQLPRRLACHEDAALAGEVTYSVWSEQAEEPAARMRQAIATLSHDPSTPEEALISLRGAAVDLAALLIRIAANARASQHAREAPEERTAALMATLYAVTRELSSRAQQLEPTHDHADAVAHHLAASLRVRVSQEALRGLGAGSPSEHAVTGALAAIRNAWLALATNEYVAVATLDARVDKPTYAARFASLPEAIAEPAATVICGARLLGRPGVFRHRRAWREQAVALTYALEAYVAGHRGHAPSLAQAQAITLTRLTRATAAITMIDLARSAVQPINGRHSR